MIFPPEGLQPEVQGHNSSVEIVTADTILKKLLIKQEAKHCKFKDSNHIYSNPEVQILLRVLSTLQYNKLKVADFSEWEAVNACASLDDEIEEIGETW